MVRRERTRTVLIATLLLIPVLTITAMAQSEGGQRERDGESRSHNRKSRIQPGSRGDSITPQLLPPDRPRPSRWYFGVRVNYRDTGAQVMDVLPRSPAMRIGLEKGDLIVAVAGYQVGYVNGRLFRLERELDYRADRHGHVRMLVQNHRNGDLTNIDVRLDPAQRPLEPQQGRSLTGTVTSRSITQLGKGAKLTIQLVDISRRLGPMTPIAQREYTNLGPLPIPFELPYAPERLDPNRQYALRAFLSIHGVAALRTRETYRVRTDGSQGRIHMILERSR